jgi:hypothetical protein
LVSAVGWYVSGGALADANRNLRRSAFVEEARKLAGLEPGAPVTLVDLPRPKPLWQQMLDSGRDDEEVLLATAESLQQWWQTGAVQVPGTLWAPPIWVR